MDKYSRRSPEGSHLRVLREIRVRAEPSWTHQDVELTIWFIKDRDPDDGNPDWPRFAERWSRMFDDTGRFRTVFPVVCRLDDIMARDYVESDVLDFDSLSVGRIRL